MLVMDVENKKHLLLAAERKATVFSASMTARGSMGVPMAFDAFTP
jgi:hypothetical protein